MYYISLYSKKLIETKSKFYFISFSLKYSKQNAGLLIYELISQRMLSLMEGVTRWVKMWRMFASSPWCFRLGILLFAYLDTWQGDARPEGNCETPTVSD